ncbi:hypothetical protein WMY93_016834 [Mugilogobius chulae]|uniref:Uncharacterized protein n=1 Tax=Mugilogobius chulae TaxID=88201 RepID=A0AAW0NWQ9_9GOBI
MENALYRPVSALERELQVLNQKAEQERRQKLQLIDKQFKFSYKTLQQRKDFWRKEQRKLVTVRICEPKAIVDIAMNEINELSGVRSVQTAYGTRQKVKFALDERQSRSISAPVTQRSKVQCTVSLLQMKNVALIDSISEKEKALRRQKAREEMERMRKAQMEALQRRVQEFMERMKEKNRADSTEEPT